MFWKTTNYRAGHFAEKIALLWLILKGYRPVAMNVMTGRGTGAGEIDLIVKRGKTLVFVEVKKRLNEERARSAIHPKNQVRIQRAAEVFLARNPKYKNFNIRYDAVFISPEASGNRSGSGSEPVPCPCPASLTDPDAASGGCAASPCLAPRPH